jgi:beta-galactosidase
MGSKWIVLSVIVLAGFLTFGTSCQKEIETTSAKTSAARVVVNFNRDWKFIKQDPCCAEQPDYNDSSWEKVRLPHDWAIKGPFNPKEDGYAGKLPWKGVGWYRKTFLLDKADAGRRVYFDFDGVMAFPMVYINGRLAGQWDYGYMSFRVDATPFVKFGKENIIAVKADTRNHGTRWYPGAGIYRKVTMTKLSPVHIAHWGIYITTPKITDDSATVNVQTTIENHRKSKAKPKIDVTLIDPDGKSVASLKTNGKIPANGTVDINLTFVIQNPKRWDINSPKLYRVQTIVRLRNKIIDSDMTTFGIREFQFTANDGFHLNGRRVRIKGVCLHHDQGALGAAFYTRAMERQLEIMKNMGANAIRTSHNTPAPEVLELCDRMGFIVWDEAFDKWDKTADRFDPCKMPLEQYGEKQIRNFVMRDRNHPCVVIWSIGNEIPIMTRTNQEGLTAERVKFMSDYFRKYDPTRPVSLACNIPSVARSHILDALDFAGWNYQRNYTKYRRHYPKKSAVYSESASAISTRGFYELPLAEKKTHYSNIFQISSYDRNAAPWADIPDVEFKRMEQDSYVAGEFVWTGFDYLGEPTPFSKQARSSYFGIVDTAGIPKDRYYIYRSYWAPEKTTVHMLPHWNWPDRIGQNVPVYVYTNGDSAEIFLNGKSLGKRSKAKKIYGPVYYNVIDKYRLCFNDVNYEPGELKAVAYKNGVEIGQAVVRTAGEPVKIRLTPDRTRLSATGDDLCYILIEALDVNDTLCPLADNEIRFKIEGPGTIAGADNGNPLSLELFQDDKHKLFFGKAVLIVRAEEGRIGEIRVTAESNGLKTAEIIVNSE